MTAVIVALGVLYCVCLPLWVAWQVHKAPDACPECDEYPCGCRYAKKNKG